jgi:precorrin-2 dehydrogenase/sirohydrochlorin ferrochelatase
MSLYYPMMLKIEGRPCTVVGGGAVAQRKVETLLEYGAVVTVISPSLTEKLKLLLENNKIHYKNKVYETGDLTGSFLVYGVTDDKVVNEKCKKEAESQNMLVNIGDSSELSDFILPAVLKRGSLIITISTEGKSPALSRKIRRQLEILYDESYDDLLETLGKIRTKALMEIPSIEDRKALFHQLVYDELDKLDKLELKRDMEELKKAMWEVYKYYTVKKGVSR